MLATASGSEPKPKATEYPAHAELGDISIGCDYLVRSFFGEGHTYALENYLVVEVAVYPRKGSRAMVNAGNFTLRLNGKKDIRLPQTPGMVAASLKYPDWDHPVSAEATAGAGGADVIVGRPQTRERFPGDPFPRRKRLPDPPRAPAPENPSGMERQPEMAPHEIVVRDALPEGETSQTVCGFLYFSHRGSTKKIRSVELLYDGLYGSATLRLR
jgi:hypothetical protein